MTTTSYDQSWSKMRASSSAGSLTRVFTPSSDCPSLQAIYRMTSPTSSDGLTTGFQLTAMAYMPPSAWGSRHTVINTCYPSGGLFDQVFGYFSPGVYCPSGWTSAMTMLNSGVHMPSSQRVEATDSESASSLLRSLLPSETMVLCCPDHMHFTISLSGPWCRATFDQSTLVGYGAFETTVTSTYTSTATATATNGTYTVVTTGTWKSSSAMAGNTTYTVPIKDTASFSVGIPLKSTVTGNGPVTAIVLVRPVQLRWQSSDEVAYLTQPSTTNTDISISFRLTGAVATAPTETLDTATEAIGISKGGITGIAVGAVGVALLVLAGIMVLRYRRKRLRERASQLDISGGGYMGGKPELEVPEKSPVMELPVVELAGSDEKGHLELDSVQRFPGTYELGNTTHTHPTDP
ncbi:hypothetical protein B0T25DRAFT_562218 [Lasiosphaeria hispida]|uniref:Uncharacterized protein n=1 Tax=Lasiosphaeria hispida TaxID=260671 RepID=A0AAJ0HV07_9PEZI|nr:hypothetical protein B0T25DRAFT_562218 [Lasiosphaeria hispida]